MRYMRNMLVVAGIFLATASGETREAKNFDLGSATVDYLTFGIRSLEQDLRLKELEMCVHTACSTETKTKVALVSSRPTYFPSSLHWPNNGAILIVISEEGSNASSQLATEEGCKLKLGVLRLIASSPKARFNYARFFVPELEWPKFANLNADTSMSRRIRDISSRIFFLIDNNLRGVQDRLVRSACFGTLVGDDATIILPQR